MGNNSLKTQHYFKILTCINRHFVPNLTLGASIISAIRPHTEAYFGNVFSKRLTVVF
jgi:hypothetical protein